MAGAINLADDVGVSMSTVTFNNVVKCIRSAARPEDADVMAEVYYVLDEGGLPTISTRKQNERGFNVFAQAVMRAYDSMPDEAGQKLYQSIWNELISKIKADPRYAAA